MSQQLDVAVIGGGIVGLAHAWRAAARGLRVGLFERSRHAEGASVRNFGMIWPIGQPLGSMYDLAIQSRELWLTLAQESGIWLQPCGSLHLAHREDEQAVLEEFHSIAGTAGASVELLTPEAALKRSPAIQPQDLRAALWSPTEMCVDAPQAIRLLPAWLHHRFQVQFHFETPIAGVEDNEVRAADGRTWKADRVVVCSGTDMQTLFPQAYASLGLRVCKLRMLSTVPQPDGWRIGPHLASGLTLRHYRSFEACPTLAQLKRRVAEETPELDRYGIHVMAAQNEAGQVILGDSHEYDEDISVFDDAVVEQLILRELRRQVHLHDWSIQARWHGYYVKHPQRTLVSESATPRADLFCSPGGAGMTLSLGWAEAYWNERAGTEKEQWPISCNT